MTVTEALAAIRAELAQRPDGPQLDEYPLDIREKLADLLVEGWCTPAQVVEALNLASDLGEAPDVPVEQGLELMAQLGDRHNGIRGAN